ncbi:hypothetical protein CFC21_018110 [Triticum aestivum]|uniref:GRF-type domain-containing protein n=2 Tax=Triticum aestivum TaxID=4565 RepID=A0A3B6B1F0_WHEAT|nr:hypothetical protein CFC21_018110 [Triticum aestivum]
MQSARSPRNSPVIQIPSFVPLATLVAAAHRSPSPSPCARRCPLPSSSSPAMSSSSSARSGRRGRTVVVPLISCPRCGCQVRFYVSNTEEHEGWVFYRCVTQGCVFWHWEREYVAYLVDHRYLVGHEAVDAIGATEDRREQLERETEGRRRVAERNACQRISMQMQEQPGASMNITRAEARALLNLGVQMLLKLLLGGVLVLVVLCVMLLLKK